MIKRNLIFREADQGGGNGGGETREPKPGETKTTTEKVEPGKPEVHEKTEKIEPAKE